MTTIERLNNTIVDLGFDAIYDEHDLIKMMYLIDVCGSDLVELLEDYNIVEDTVMYNVSTYEELAELFVDEGYFGDIPDHLTNYIDYDKIGRDLQFDFDEFECDGEYYLMRAN